MTDEDEFDKLKLWFMNYMVKSKINIPCDEGLMVLGRKRVGGDVKEDGMAEKNLEALEAQWMQDYAQFHLKWWNHYLIDELNPEQMQSLFENVTSSYDPNFGNLLEGSLLAGGSKTAANDD